MASDTASNPQFMASDTASNSQFMASDEMEFTLEEIVQFTGNFDSKNRIGTGAFSRVYKGKMNSQIVAVKEYVGPLAAREFNAETNFLRAAQHPNILKYIGRAKTTFLNEPDQTEQHVDEEVGDEVDGEERFFLVSEYLPKTLTNKHSDFTWDQLTTTIQQIASALKYIHSLSETNIYYDLKTDNILFDDENKVKICDFGSLGATANQAITKEYAAPELLKEDEPSLEITQSVDTYSFGIVVLQLIMRATLDEIQGIISSAIKNQQTRGSAVHQELRKDCKLEEAKDMTSLALKCIESDAKNRPTMTDVVEEFEQIQTKAKAERAAKKGESSGRKKKKKGGR